jgi:hypothetical protein
MEINTNGVVIYFTDIFLIKDVEPKFIFRTDDAGIWFLNSLIFSNGHREAVQVVESCAGRHNTQYVACCARSVCGQRDTVIVFSWSFGGRSRTFKVHYRKCPDLNRGSSPVPSKCKAAAGYAQ